MNAFSIKGLISFATLFTASNNQELAYVPSYRDELPKVQNLRPYNVGVNNLYTTVQADDVVENSHYYLRGTQKPVQLNIQGFDVRKCCDDTGCNC